MNNQSILRSIQEAVESINELTRLQKEKSIMICKGMFNQFIIDKTCFSQYKQFANNWFYTVVPTKKYYNLKHLLVKHGILECDDWYKFKKDSKKGIAKGYRFNSKFFTAFNTSSTDTTFTFSNSSKEATISYYCPTSENQKYQAYYYNLLPRLKFDSDVDELINELSIVRLKDLTLNENIKEEYLKISSDKEEPRCKAATALNRARAAGMDLIKFNKKFYIDHPEHFIVNKSTQLKITYCQSVFNINNGLFYCNRNDTNYRLDYNLTALKKKLFTKLTFDGERLTELDIANAQFAIAAHINPDIDEPFVSYSQAGTIYQYVENKLGLPEGNDEGKKLMFQIAFDKVKSIAEYDSIRTLFPKFMTWVDQYKKKHGYKSFANLLQRKEAEIMIDGLLKNLIDGGYEVFTIHDAIRVKESQAKEIHEVATNYFKSIGFLCHLRDETHTKQKEDGNQ